MAKDWRTASRESAGIAPAPHSTDDAIVQVYAARTFGWRGRLASHTWIATRAQGADHYLVHHVMGWRRFENKPLVVSGPDIPDRNWFGNRPILLFDRRGADAGKLIPCILEAVASYPWPDHYVMWPGPNSNTFVAHVLRNVPALQADLPVTAIGKDFLESRFFAATPSNTGFQFSLRGVLGVMLARREGIELNLLGLSLGLDLLAPAIKLPGLGRIGWSRSLS